MKGKKTLATLLSVVLLVSMAALVLTACGEKPEVVDVQLLYFADKDTYIEGEKFDTTGLQVTALYSDGTRKEIKDYQIDKTGALTEEDKVIKITYGEYVMENPITVIKAGDVIVLQFTQGIDTITLYADGGVHSGRISTVTAKTRIEGARWSWDGKTLEIWIPDGTGSCQPLGDNLEQKDGMTKMNVQYDEFNNITLNYIFQRWTITAAASYDTWYAALNGKTFPIAQN